MKRVIVSIDGRKELSKEERKNYAKDHPGERLCFRLRYPDFPLYFAVIVMLLVLLEPVLVGILQ